MHGTLRVKRFWGKFNVTVESKAHHTEDDSCIDVWTDD